MIAGTGGQVKAAGYVDLMSVDEKSHILGTHVCWL
jgi:hypothetical protein